MYFNTDANKPYVEIVHQPIPYYRIRYKEENRNTFLLSENHQSPGHKIENIEGNFPCVKIVNGCGPAFLVVSCVNKCEPYFVHPHELNGFGCNSGIAILKIGQGETLFNLFGISIAYIKKENVQKSIKLKEAQNINPFNLPYEYDYKKIDLNQVRLCFQVFLTDPSRPDEIIQDEYHCLKPVVSNPIYNCYRNDTFKILHITELYAQAKRNKKIAILFKKLERNENCIRIKFYDNSGWKKVIELSEKEMHYKSAICFEVPTYKDITQDTKVYFKIFVLCKAKNHKNKDSMEIDDDEDDENINNKTDPFEFIYKP